MSDINLLNEFQQFKLAALKEHQMVEKTLDELSKEIQEVHEEGQSKRFNEGKPKLSYILYFPAAIKMIGKIMELGAAKYGDDNWKLGGKPDKEYLDSMMRHLTSWLSGETYDPDSGCNHLGHMCWNILALIQLNHSTKVCKEDDFNERLKYWSEKVNNGE